MTLNLRSSLALLVSASLCASVSAAAGQILFGSNSGKCLTVASLADGAAVNIAACASPATAQQTWTLISGGLLQIGGKFCLDVTAGQNADGVKMQIWTCYSGSANQAFTAANNQIAWSGKSKCLDVPSGNTADGSRMQLWSCSAGNPNQVWNVGGGTTTPPPTTPATGGSPIKLVQDASKCATVATNKDGTSVTIAPCDGSAGQAWTQVGNTLRVYGSDNNAKCLDIPSGMNFDGNKLQVWTCYDGSNPNQQWSVSGGLVSWRGSNNPVRCMDLSGGDKTTGNRLQIWQCYSASQNQNWSFAGATGGDDECTDYY